MAKSKRTIAVIPARYGATRLPAKPLLRETGKYLVQHVYEQVCRARKISRIVIATDDRRIMDAAKTFGAEAIMTSKEHPNGTSRCAEAVKRIPHDYVINIQGDEPEVDPELIDQCTVLLDDADMTTIATTYLTPEDAMLPSRVKVVLDRDGNALYFSRARIPQAGPALLHLGLYGYRKDFLKRIARLAPTPLSEAERLEQLRVLEHGYKIRVGVTTIRNFGGIDTPLDYAAFLGRWNGRQGSRNICP